MTGPRPRLCPSSNRQALSVPALPASRGRGVFGIRGAAPAAARPANRCSLPLSECFSFVNFTSSPAAARAVTREAQAAELQARANVVIMQLRAPQPGNTPGKPPAGALGSVRGVRRARGLAARLEARRRELRRGGEEQQVAEGHGRDNHEKVANVEAHNLRGLGWGQSGGVNTWGGGAGMCPAHAAWALAPPQADARAAVACDNGPKGRWAASAWMRSQSPGTHRKHQEVAGPKVQAIQGAVGATEKEALRCV
jgi:hypothetical protein